MPENESHPQGKEAASLMQEQIYSKLTGNHAWQSITSFLYRLLDGLYK